LERCFHSQKRRNYPAAGNAGFNVSFVLGRQASEQVLTIDCPSGSCQPASFCGKSLVMHFIEVFLSLFRSQARFRLEATQGFGRRLVFD
jgi:hypothetical protein